MTIRDIIKELEEIGYSVSYYERKDGGVRITRINGERYSGSTGNQKARTIVGAKLSEAQIKSLAKLKTPKGKGSYNKRRKASLDEETKKEIKKLQYLYRKAGKKEGKPTIRNYRYVLKKYGKKEADRLLSQSERRILGWAYVENVDALIIRIKSDLDKRKSSGMKKALKRIKELREVFLERWISEVYELVYMWELGSMNGDEAGEKILAIID